MVFHQFFSLLLFRCYFSASHLRKLMKLVFMFVYQIPFHIMKLFEKLFTFFSVSFYNFFFFPHPPPTENRHREIGLTFETSFFSFLILFGLILLQTSIRIESHVTKLKSFSIQNNEKIGSGIGKKINSYPSLTSTFYDLLVSECECECIE